MWRCGRCALIWAYEVEGAEGVDDKGTRLRVLYVLEGGLVETGKLRERRDGG